MQKVIDKEWKTGVVFFTGLVLFHLAFSILLSIIARSTFLASLHNGQGVWNFASDSVVYHQEALRLLSYLKNGDYGSWWVSSPWWHVKWIALSYAVITPDPLSFAPINALTWAVSVVCVYKIVRQLFPDHRVLAVLSTTMFGLWPSYLFHCTQLLKDPLYSMGILAMVWGWMALLSGKRGIGFSILVCFGVLLAHLNRSYILEALVFLTLLATMFVLWRKRETLAHALLACVLVLGLYAYEHRAEILLMFRPPPPPPTVVQPPAVKDPWRYEDWVPDWFEWRIKAIINTRLGWATSYPEAGSNIDTDVRFYSVRDVIEYVPRALQIGFLAPFPRHWFEKPKVAGRPSRVFAGIEMMVWYLLLPGFLYFIISRGNPIQVRLWLLIYSGILVLLTALVVTNLGALYRMRFVYFLPILIGGLEGWATLYRQRLQKTTR